MQNIVRPPALVLATLVALPLVFSLGACSKAPDNAPVATSGVTGGPSNAIVPPPPGDSTPKPIDSNAAPAMPESDRNTGASQSTVGTASSGAPPYTVGGAPEGNPSPGQGTKGDTKKP